MRKIMILCSVILLVACSKSQFKPQDRIIELDDSDVSSKIYRYVSFVAQGDGSGTSPKNAADFLNASFWETTNELLTISPVDVYFSEGYYTRAFTLRPLILNGLGNIDNRLTLKGMPGKTIFNVPDNLSLEKSTLFDIKNSQNIHIRDFDFTGDGLLNYAFRVTSDGGNETRNILIENCSWTDMHGIVYGAAGVHQKGTSHVTFLKCTFKRVGIDVHSHHIYNAYGPSFVSVINSHFEDCTGDYVRFRDSMDYGMVKGSTFIRNQGYDGKVFISMPLFNSRPPVGDEYFCTNYAFIGNNFTNNATSTTDNAITFYHMGFSPPEWNYLLTNEEGQILQNGSTAEKKALLLNNFGIDVAKVRISNNIYSSKINRKIALGTFVGYDSPNLGFSGWGDISTILNESDTAFPWENSAF